MSDRHFVGLDLTSFEDRKKMRPISRVTFMLDDQNSVTAGDDTGLEIVADNPHATQEMANAVLARLRGYQYHAFEAGGASLDPAAELGDGITAGGVYSFIGRLNDGGDGYPGIDAPGEAELENEYPSAGPMTQEFNRKLAQTRSSITKTAEQIRLEVSNEMQGLSASFTVQLDGITQRVQGLDGKYSEVRLTLDGLTITGPDGSTRIKGSSIETGSIAANSIRADQVNLTGAITWGDLSGSVQGDIDDAWSMASSASSTASSALRSANSAQSTIDSWSYTYGGQTYIDGAMLMTGTVIASKLMGGSVSLLASNQATAGIMTISAATTAAYAVELSSYSGLRLLAQSGVYIQGNGYEAIQLNNGRVSALGSSFFPMSSNMTLGDSSYLWSAIYASNGTIQTSDANKKNNIEPLPDKYLCMLDRITPRRYKMNDGLSGRYHVGFIAQEVEAAMMAADVGPKEFGGYVKDKDEEGNDIYMLRYDEFIAILWAKMRRLEEIINRLEVVV